MRNKVSEAPNHAPESKQNESPVETHHGKNSFRDVYFDQIELADLNIKKSFEEEEGIKDFDTIKVYKDSMTLARMKNMRHMEVVMRGSTALIMLIVLFCVRIGGKSTGIYPEEICIVDKGHIWTEPVNELVHESERWLTFFEISSSGMMDIVMILYLT
jgi:hypothetical protein